MPLYEYRCNECEKTFEVLQRMNAEPVKECQYCGGSCKKIISTSSFQFKGSGWYVTDYKDRRDQKSRDQKMSSEKASKVESTTKEAVGSTDEGNKDATIK